MMPIRVDHECPPDMIYMIYVMDGEAIIGAGGTLSTTEVRALAAMLSRSVSEISGRDADTPASIAP